MVDLWCFPASQILYWMLPAWREKVRHKLHAVWQKHKKPSQVVKYLKNKYIYESIIIENAMKIVKPGQEVVSNFEDLCFLCFLASLIDIV